MRDYVQPARTRVVRHVRPIVALGWIVSASLVSTQVAGQDLEEQRKNFVQATSQLSADDRDGFERSLKQLVSYPLYDYLIFEQLQKSWAAEEPTRSAVTELNAFERRTGHASLTGRLTRHLQKRYADTEQWALFLGVSKSRLAARMPCTTVRARHELGQLESSDETLLELWVKPAKHPKLCSEVIDSVGDGSAPPIVSIWERIYAAMEANKPQYAKPMLDYLASADRQRVKAWIDTGDKPQSLLLGDTLADNTVLNRRIIVDLLVDWSREDTVAAVEHWLKIRNNYTFFDDRYYDTHHALVMRAAYRRLPEAQAWLEATTERRDDLELAEWRVRTALLVEDWPSVIASISRLPAEEQEEDHWAYWVARANEQLGQEAAAQQIYTELAELQSYYGFLSADRLDLEYAIYDEPITPDESVLSGLRNDPALIRAREFDHVDLPHESRREWNNWLVEKESDVLAASAVLASEWGLNDRAIYSAGLSGDDYRRAISLRFPILYRSQVAKASSEHSIEPSWIFGVMRRESAYIADVRSHAGAVGLMQLMPRTARYVAADLQGQKNWQGDLTDAETNIELGTHYLRYVMDRFDGHQVLATASYNAGPHRVDQWLRENETDADLWIDTIVFTETRRYVRAVLAYAAIYDYHLTGKAQRLSRKLTTVPAAPST